FPKLLSSSSGISLFGRIANKKRHFSINNNGNIESRVGFRSGSKLGPGKRLVARFVLPEICGGGGGGGGGAMKLLWAVEQGRKQEGKEGEWRWD
ncbi:hypothetical protein V6N12_033880, partial [Hibiscus sabdariffa]